ncbi:MAG: SMP-30/gluconolactonase/LRE family protein [Verrucomicrobiota bacterium]|nr:SMP-30/gluconolactonase/LRE family protein [Verrucomicrobiota bacterium]
MKMLLALLTSLALAPAALSQSASDLVALGAQAEKLAGGFEFTEGPAGDRDGNLFFSDIPNNRIHQWSADGKLSTFRENSGGANGLYFDAENRLLACEGGNRRVTRSEKDGRITVLADQCEGKKLNSPNDLWVAPTGGIYFTDPRYGQDPVIEQPGHHVYLVPAAGGKVVRLITDLVKPNGIIGTADGKRLYVADPGARTIYGYDLQPDGSVANRKVAAPQGSDGLTLDERGNLYATGKGVVVYSPAGEKIAEIAVPESPANLTFGGQDGRTLFITARTGFYAVKMKVRGGALAARAP